MFVLQKCEEGYTIVRGASLWDEILSCVNGMYHKLKTLTDSGFIDTKYSISCFSLYFASALFPGCRPRAGIQIHPLYETKPFWLPAE
jgi:hypothetical protein